MEVFFMILDNIAVFTNRFTSLVLLLVTGMMFLERDDKARVQFWKFHFWRALSGLMLINVSFFILKRVSMK